MTSPAAIDRSPTRLSGSVAVLAAVLAFATVGAYSWPALAAGAAGVALIVAGLLVGSEPAVTGGAAALAGGVLVGGVEGVPALLVLFAAALAVLAWDAATFAVGLGRQLGRAADTARLEAVHLAATVSVGAATVGVGYALFRTAGGGLPVTALVFLLLGAVLLSAALR